ncbi:MAG: heparinase II/III family protein [Myxococcales bacterium]|nr:heparinase II/III family protein [Myxococcales bacterium]
MKRPGHRSDGPARLWRTLRPVPPRVHAHRLANEVRKRAWRPLLPQLVRRWRRKAKRAQSDPLPLRRLHEALTAAPVPTMNLTALAGEPLPNFPPESWALLEMKPLSVYHAHYLEWAEALVASGRDQDIDRCWQALESWYRQSPELVIPWEPYPRARRTLACLRAAARLQGHLNPRADMLAAWLTEIALAAGLPLRWLRERHLGGNHLLTNLLAEATAALVAGQPNNTSALLSQWRLQFGDDGSHVEGAPMYQAVILEDALTLAGLAGPGHELAPSIAQATSWLRAMRRPDGTLPAFGDTDPSVCDRLPLVARALVDATVGQPTPRESAWTARNDAASVWVHTGPMTFDPQPGHAHADALSIVYSRGDQSILSDAGLVGYAETPLRPWNRSEAAHSVVEIPGAPQLELWGTFRVGRRGVITVIDTGVERGWQWLAATYTWPGNRHTQLRFVALSADGSLYLVDEMRHDHPVILPALQRLRLHDEIQPTDSDEHWSLDVASSLRLETSGACWPEPSRRFPGLGLTSGSVTMVGTVLPSAPRHALISSTLRLADVTQIFVGVRAAVAARSHFR